MVLGTAYNVRKTACKGGHIDYLSTFRGITKKEVDSHIQLLLDSDSDLPARDRATKSSPIRRTVKRSTARAQPASNGSGGRSVAGRV